MLAFKRGEKGAYQAIYDLYATRVQSVCRRMLLQSEDAEEASQETFLRVYQALSRFNGRYQLGPWITRIATNICLDQLRSKGRRPQITGAAEELLTLQPSGDVDDTDPCHVVVRKAEGRHVRRVLQSLPPLHRAAIVLRDFEGLSYEEIAAALSITDSQVKALIHRARQNFKKSWASQVAALLPFRFLNRLRGTELDKAQGLSNTAGPLTQAATSCSVALQQCGQYVMERAAGVVTAALIGGVATAGVVVAHADSPPAVSDVAIQAATDAHVLAPRHEGPATHGKGASAEPRSSGVPANEVVPEPVPTSTPEPEPPAEEGDPGVVDDPSTDNGGPSEEPDATPTEAPEPDGFSATFDSDMSFQAHPCDGCFGPADEVSSMVAVNESGMSSFQQTFTGTAQAGGGSGFYGLRVQQWSNDGTDHDMDFYLETAEGTYHYSAHGGIVQRGTTPWGGWAYSYLGTYELSASPGSPEDMPRSGTYTVDLTFSWRRTKVVSAAISLSENNS